MSVISFAASFKITLSLSKLFEHPVSETVLENAPYCKKKREGSKGKVFHLPLPYSKPLLNGLITSIPLILIDRRR